MLRYHVSIFCILPCILNIKQLKTNDITWQKCPVLSCPVLSCPVLSCYNHHDQHDNQDHGNGDHEEVGSYMRKLEVGHKEVGGCLISYNLQKRSWRLSQKLTMSEWMNDSVSYLRRYRAALKIQTIDKKYHNVHRNILLKGANFQNGIQNIVNSSI